MQRHRRADDHFAGRIGRQGNDGRPPQNDAVARNGQRRGEAGLPGGFQSVPVRADKFGRQKLRLETVWTGRVGQPANRYGRRRRPRCGPDGSRQRRCGQRRWRKTEVPNGFHETGIDRQARAIQLARIGRRFDIRANGDNEAIPHDNRAPFNGRTGNRNQAGIDDGIAARRCNLTGPLGLGGGRRQQGAAQRQTKQDRKRGCAH